MENKTVVILGGGMAGLSAGYELAKNGIQVTVLEKENEVGGLARTIEVNGFRFDTGPHRWFTKKDYLNKWLHSLLGDEIIEVNRKTRIYFDKKYFDYPIKIKSAMQIGIVNGIKAIIDYLWIRLNDRIRPPKINTMEDGYVHQFGRKLYTIFFKRYSEKLWGRKCSEISSDWINQRTRGLNISTLIKDALSKSKNVVSLVDKFDYPKYGAGRIAEKLKEEIIKLGGVIKTGSTVEKILTENDRITKIVTQDTDGLKEIVTDYCISTIPVNLLVSKMDNISENVLSASRELQFRSEIFVAVMINKSHITNDNWVYIHPQNLPYVRFMEMDNWGEYLSESGKTTIVFEIACNFGDDVWNRDNQEIINLVCDSFVNEFKLISKSDILHTFVHRQEHGYPVYSLDYKKNLEVVKNYLRGLTNLELAGRNGLFRYNNMDHSVETGILAAKNIILGEKKYDVEKVNDEHEYIEEKNINE